jgi:hypothetical protein
MIVWVVGEFVLAWPAPYLAALASALVAYVGIALVATSRVESAPAR